MITLVVARARGGAIGKDNDIPWFAPEDLASFQRETMGGALIMGRKTWDSLPVKPLKNRMNIVVTSQGVDAEHCVPSVTEAVDLAQDHGYGRIYGIGGAGIYCEMLAVADRLLVTDVDLDVVEADAFFPDFDDAEWRCLSKYSLRAEDPACVRHEYLRI
jgi:dihydrofolate reductase